jgi:hypothetical protein
MSIRAYCAQRGVKESAFYWWRARLARRETVRPSPAAAFVPVVIHSPSVSDRVDGMAIELRGGRVLRLPAMPVAQVVELVRALEGDMKAGAA